MHIVPLEAVSRENSITQPGHHQLGTRSSSGERHQANCALRLSQSFIKIPGTARSPTTSSRAQLQAYEMGGTATRVGHKRARTAYRDVGVVELGVRRLPRLGQAGARLQPKPKAPSRISANSLGVANQSEEPAEIEQREAHRPRRSRHIRGSRRRRPRRRRRRAGGRGGRGDGGDP